MGEIPDRRSTPRLVAAWFWWLAQCVVITVVQLLPGAGAADYPRVPRRDCSDLRHARYERKVHAAERRETRRRWSDRLSRVRRRQ
ncbi:hypothetical protein [Gordonia sp. (in: high G+C Gram-positive bacteria)]|uniref:hypothetical protein n=1 Tax=Gordonia sp. (in: high G+C Gram-positive bacteria) TaxID=84139 RepID=UPI0039E591F6